MIPIMPDLESTSSARENKPFRANTPQDHVPGTTRMHLGHALDALPDGETDDDQILRNLAGLLRGEVPLLPRKPKEPGCADQAERILGCTKRPIYAFVGDLHPELGSIGLVISATWAERCVSGIS